MINRIETLRNRIKALRTLFHEKKVDAFLISSLSNIIYLTGFSGFSREDRDAFLLITKKGHYIFTHGIYKEAVQKFIPNFTLVETTREKPLAGVLQDIQKKERLKKIGFEDTDISVAEYIRITKDFPKGLFVPTTHCVEKLRIIKTREEVQRIKKACELTDKTFSFILTKIKEGMTEKEVAFEMDFFMKKHGAETAFPTIVAFGSNASLPHHQTSDAKLTKNSFILLDFGAQLHNYCADMTRTLFFGKPSKEQKKVYQTVYDAQQKAIDHLSSLLANKKRIIAKDIDHIAREHIISQGYPSIPHSLGHGIGIDVHEAPRVTQSAKEELTHHMVFSIEPGIYLPGFCGVRIEDLVVIEKNALQILTTSSRMLIELS